MIDPQTAQVLALIIKALKAAPAWAGGYADQAERALTAATQPQTAPAAYTADPKRYERPDW